MHFPIIFFCELRFALLLFAPFFVFACVLPLPRARPVPFVCNTFFNHLEPFFFGLVFVDGGWVDGWEQTAGAWTNGNPDPPDTLHNFIPCTEHKMHSDSSSQGFNLKIILFFERTVYYFATSTHVIFFASFRFCVVVAAVSIRLPRRENWISWNANANVGKEICRNLLLPASFFRNERKNGTRKNYM